MNFFQVSEEHVSIFDRATVAYLVCQGVALHRIAHGVDDMSGSRAVLVLCGRRSRYMVPMRLTKLYGTVIRGLLDGTGSREASRRCSLLGSGSEVMDSM